MKKKTGLLLLIISWVIFPSCQHDFTFKGVVFNRHNHKPVKGAYVRINSNYGNNLLETDSTGQYYYYIDNVKPNATFTVTVDASSLLYQYENTNKVISLPNGGTGGTYVADLTVQPLYARKYGCMPIRFGFGKTDITQDIKDTVLPDIIDIVKDTIIGGEHVEIDGFAAKNEGDSITKQRLSEQRAEACKDYLVSKGVSPRCIEAVKGFGDSRPIAEDGDAGAINRRVEFRFIHIGN